MEATTARAGWTRPGRQPTAGVRRAALWVLLAGGVFSEIGLGWDIRWHLLIGRDAFWIPPHVLIYTGVAAGAMLSFAVLISDTARARTGRPVAGSIRVLGLVGTAGFQLAWWGIALTILAAPVDDLWHRWFGLDVTLWSPPHLLGFAGGDLHGLGLLLIAREVWPPGSRARHVALAIDATLIVGDAQTLADPGLLTAFFRGGIFFFTHPILAALGLTFVLTLTTRLTAARGTPIVLAAGALGLHLVIIAVATAGFAVLQPGSVVDAVIATDLTSDIAASHEMARRDGLPPGPSPILRALPLLPAAVMALVDVRRRWRAASLSFGLALFLVFFVVLAGAPSLSHARPAALNVGVGLAATLAASLAGGWAGSRLATSALFRERGRGPE